MIKGILKGVLGLTPPPDTPPKDTASVGQMEQIPSVEKLVDISVSMSELMYGSGLNSLDDLFQGLFELTKNNTLSVHKNIQISQNSVQSSDDFWELLLQAIKRFTTTEDDDINRLHRNQFQTEDLHIYQQ